jgi:hypothetical protein
MSRGFAWFNSEIVYFEYGYLAKHYGAMPESFRVVFRLHIYVQFLILC